jgi:anti-sigma factor RsiW
MTDLELSITQYLDGSLSPSERAALEKQMESDAKARLMLEEHRKLDVLLRASPLPQLRWDALASQISSAVAKVEIPVEAEPLRVGPMRWLRIGAPLAIAASMLVGIGVAFHLFRSHANVPVISAPAAVAVITGPQVESTDAPSQVQITVGPAQVASADDSMLWRYSDDVTSRPAHVTVASGVNPTQDNSLPVFDMQ